MTPENFLAVLKGDAGTVEGKGSGKVLKTDKNSKLFIFFSDHGASGLVAFPKSMLYADELNNTFKYMYDHKLYDKLVFYLEACESGSMFEGILDNNMNIYAMTAANAHESSWGTYCYPDDVINGEHVGSCLGDLFSVNWMEDTDDQDPTSETLQDQFLIVKRETNQSHVMQYGQLSWLSQPVGEFVGSYDPEEYLEYPIDHFWRQLFNRAI